MKLVFECTNGVKTIRLHVDKQLDLSAFGKFSEAASLANEHYNAIIVVDLENTQQLLDSGKSMLLFLHYKCGRLKDRIHLVNVKPWIMDELVQDKLSLMFNIEEALDNNVKLAAAKSCQERYQI